MGMYKKTAMIVNRHPKVRQKSNDGRSVQKISAVFAYHIDIIDFISNPCILTNSPMILTIVQHGVFHLLNLIRDVPLGKYEVHS